jgi:hypothetical protein
MKITHTIRPIRVSISGLSLLVALFALSCAYAKWAAHRARKDAEVLLTQLHNLQVGKSTVGDIQALADAHRRFLVGKTLICEGDVCHFDWIYDNSLLRRLGIASKTAFGVRVQTDQGRVDRITMDLLCGARPSAYGIRVVEAIGELPLEQEGQSFAISNIHGETTWVRMIPGVGKTQRDAAYSLRLNCLDQIGRCRSKRELLPSLAGQIAP